MSTRLIWFAPLILLTGLLAVYGFRLGWIAANITETDVIEARAAEYLASANGDARPSDCVAFPSQDRGIWIIVRCGGGRDAAITVYEYHVNRFGGVEYSGAPKTDARMKREDDA